MSLDDMEMFGKEKDFSEPILHHILYVESDAVQIEKYGFLRSIPRSIWVLIENGRQLKEIQSDLFSLFHRGRLKLFNVTACEKGELHKFNDIYSEFDGLKLPF